MGGSGIMLHDAILNTHDKICNIVGDSLDDICVQDKDGNRVEIDKDLVNDELTKLQNAEPMRLLRKERDRRLSEVDWWTSRATDGIELTQAQKDYRKALRDLPSTSSPKLDDNDNLTNVSWPTKPS